MTPPELHDMPARARCASPPRERRTGLPPVIVTAPVNAATPNDLTVLMDLALRGHGHVALVALPEGNSSDLADALLNALGRPGVERAVRRYLSSDLSTLTPFLAGHNVRDILVFEAENLDTNSIEQLLAIDTLCGIRTWLVPGMPLKRIVDEHVRAHAPTQMPLHTAAGHWQRRDHRPPRCERALPDPTTPCPVHQSHHGCLRDLGRHLALGHIPSAAARMHLSELLRREDTTADQRLTLNVRHGRRTVVPAAAALSLAAVSPTRQTALTLGTTALDGSTLHFDVALSIKGPAQTAVAMQRLHARIVGQRSSGPLMTLDGTPLQARVLTAMAEGVLR